MSADVEMLRDGALTADGWRRAFYLALAASLTFRVWLATVLPITGDEAYFYYWGWRPDWGFYDHPPMVGWWLALLERWSSEPWVLRMPVIVQPGIVALIVGFWLQRAGSSLPWAAALLVLLAPASVWNVLITTDTPLVYFSFLSGLAFLRAQRADHPGWYLAAGLLLGGAILSKYFAAFLGLAYAGHCLQRPTRARLGGLGLVVLGALPAGLINAWWNSSHCWANILFNVYNRHGGAGASWRTPLLFAVMMLYLATPTAAWALLRWARAPSTAADSGAQLRALAWIALLPLALFALMSAVKTIGMHWVLSFLPFAFMLLALQAADLTRLSARFAAGFAALHVVAIAVIANVPLETWRSTRIYDGIVMTVRADELLAKLAPYEKEFEFATDGYSPSVTMGFNAGRYFLVFGEASSHARHDDILTDFRALDGRNILVLLKETPDPARYQPYFHEVRFETFNLHGAQFHLVLGRGFRYRPYRDTVLAAVRDRFYRVPRWLPMTACYFCDRYFPGSSCRGGP